ncbi:MAG TPA: DUF362 domain-containing protein [Methanobacteriaceae archaeon]|nr:DUF362 domain-containing protein [Methanobacteriaceae archaeon]
MKSEVYFTDLVSRGKDDSKIKKLERLFEAANLDNIFQKDKLTAVKLHFGEEGNDSYINPVFVRVLVDKVIQNGAKPFLTDTNTLYYGSRHNTVDHLKTAIKHGFDYSVGGAPLVIADGLCGDNWVSVEVNLKHFKEVKIAGDIEKSDSMLVLSHFKGHGMSGFGGAIKNLAMGCAAAPGKLEQHECAKPFINTQCTVCGSCVDSCPVSAILLQEDTAEINYDLCIACNNCLETCPDSCIELDWEAMEPFMEKMSEYAHGAVKNKPKQVAYINFLLNITPDCDCVSWSDRPFVPDIGILVSKDPVAIDEASYDLVNQQSGLKNSLLLHNHDPGEDKFRGLWEMVDGKLLLEYAQKIGMGSRDYELLKI